MNLAKKIYETVYPNQILVAQHDYDTDSIGDLSFKKDEDFECISEYKMWLRVRNCRTNEEGLVPRDYLIPKSCNKMENSEWYHGNISRLGAEDLLEHEAAGSFLVRQTDLNHAYSLSIKAIICVGHYKIFKVRGKYFLSEELKKKSLVDLINFYIGNENLGLFQHLISPCPRRKPKIYDLCGKYRMNLEVARDEVTILDNIGSGNFGVVVKGQWGDKTIAIKMLQNAKYQDFMKEVEPLKLLQHEHVVTFYGTCTGEEPYLMLFEYAELGSLYNYLKNSAYNVTETIRLRFIQQICSGMEYVSKKSIVHRDLAARNILVKKNMNVVIADFGLSRITKYDEYQSSCTEAAYRWLALESFKRTFTSKSDVWAFGILGIEIFTNCELPYGNLKSPKEVRKFLESGKRLDMPKDMPPYMYNKIKTCWKRNPKQRPTFSDLKCYFNELILSHYY